MTRNEYILNRHIASFDVVYQYYVEHFSHEKHGLFLSFDEFVHFMRMWPLAKHAYNVARDYYDEKFTVVELKDKDGNLIKYL